MNLKTALKAIKLNESTISMVLGAIVIIVVGVLVTNYFSSKEEGTTLPPIDVEDITLPTTHSVSKGDDLWSISEKYYGTGHNWIDISQENNIANPDQLNVNEELVIPDVAPRLAAAIDNQEDISATPTQKVEEEPLVRTNENRTHMVKKSENLWLISEKYYGSGYNWVDIANENMLSNPNQLEIGQEIIIPQTQAKTAASIINGNTAKTQNPISNTTYNVEEGDHLWNIAVRAYGDGYKWVDIAKENNLSNPDIIHLGNKLTLPR